MVILKNSESCTVKVTIGIPPEDTLQALSSTGPPAPQHQGFHHHQ